MKSHRNLGSHENEALQFTWTNALPELVALILLQLRYHFEEIYLAAVDKRHLFKCQISRLSMTCRQWSRVLRPLVFVTLGLHTQADVAFLFLLLTSPISSWLAEHIAYIELILDDEARGQIQVSSWLCRCLHESMPGIKTLYFKGRVSASNKIPVFPWRERIFLRGFLGVVNIHIEKLRFPSLASLLRLISDMPNLETIWCQETQWGSEQYSGGMSQLWKYPTTLGSRLIVAQNCLDNRALAWLYAEASTRREAPRSRRRAHPMPVARAIMEIINTLFDGSHDLNFYIPPGCWTRGEP